MTRRERKQRSGSLGLGAECNIDFPKAWVLSEDSWEERRNAIIDEATTIDPRLPPWSTSLAPYHGDGMSTYLGRYLTRGTDYLVVPAEEWHLVRDLVRGTCRL